MKITHQMLNGLGACAEQVDIFRQRWPSGVELTEENCFLAIELGLDIEWLAQEMFSEEDEWDTYDQRTEAAQIQAKAEAAKAHNECQQAWEGATTPQARKKLRTQRSDASNEAWHKYDKKAAVVFCQMVKEQEA